MLAANADLMSDVDPTDNDRTAQAATRRRALRAIAAFETLKGVTALTAGVGLLGLLHHDLHRLAAALIGHIGLDPGSHYPALFLRDVDVLRDANLRSLMLACAGYVLARGLEAYGLWNDRVWGPWLGALSGLLYVPFELRHVVLRPSVFGALVVAINLAIVAFLARQVWRDRRAA